MRYRLADVVTFPIDLGRSHNYTLWQWEFQSPGNGIGSV